MKKCYNKGVKKEREIKTMKQKLMFYTMVAIAWGGVWYTITQSLMFALCVTLALIVPTELWTLLEER